MIRITIFEYERGLKYVKGRFKQVLPPGEYWLWTLWDNTVIRKVDIRPQFVSVPGQELLTAEGIGLKVSLTAVYEVVEVEIATNQVSDYRQALYLTLQNSLRDIVAAASLEMLLANRSHLNQDLLDIAAPLLSVYGLRLTQVSIKDLMLPGELRKLYTQIVQARQEGLAQLERARGETAALRSLANAARLADDQPNLLKLRLIQAIEQSNGNTFVVDLKTPLSTPQ